MNDRRRINGPPGGTTAPVYARCVSQVVDDVRDSPQRTRPANSPRKMFLKTGVTPSASGSAYLELESSGSANSRLVSLSSSSLKLTCTVHGPRPLPRSAPFTPHVVLSAHVKYAPFATGRRRGYIRDASERDLAVHLETALRGVIIGDRWPKSGVEVVITILEGEDDQWSGNKRASSNGEQLSLMSVLGGCITVASAAIADAGIDCVDVVSGGVVALVRGPKETSMVLDPVPSEHSEILAACVVGYLPSRDEITDLWMTGDLGLAAGHELASENLAYEGLTESAIQAARGSHHVLTAALKEAAELKWRI
ncbi:MAG: 3'-5'-exoribonuclease [Claussenomyces sp. TS43310]|nr:MAG: 3'-5'-exoribonuclease [Claussenomyces sp. TS43310]